MARIAVIMSSDPRYDQQVLVGIRQALLRRSGWSLRLLRISHQLRAEDLAGMQVDGVIARGVEAELIRSLAVPLVYVGFNAPENVHAITTDDFQCGEMAAKYLIEQGLRQLLFFWRGDHAQSALRWKGFREEAEKAGLPSKGCEYFLIGSRTLARGHWQLPDQLTDLADHMSSRPQPIGLYAADETHGERAIEAARLAGLRIPDDLAIVAQTTDTPFCELSTPSLSSIAAPPERIGHEAVSLLEKLIADPNQPPARHLVGPDPIVVRDSSNFIAVSDPLVDQALRLIRREVAELRDVTALVASLPTSRPTLERRFRSALSRSPAAELRRARLHLTKQLLRETDYDLATLAAHTGFGGIAQLCREIKKETGHTPTQYRKQWR